MPAPNSRPSHQHLILASTRFVPELLRSCEGDVIFAEKILMAPRIAQNVRGE
jgi:hypothetical protein